MLTRFLRQRMCLYGLFLFASLCPAQALTAVRAKPQDRVRGPIDETRTMTRRGNTYPLAAGTGPGRVEYDLRMDRMILSLQPDATQQAQLTQLLEQQRDPESALYHKFLTPSESGAQYGVSTN